jgi:hypothetical protein
LFIKKDPERPDQGPLREKLEGKKKKAASAECSAFLLEGSGKDGLIHGDTLP